MNRLWRDGAALIALGCAVACAKTQARVPAPVTALAMPAPPPHALIPVEFEEPVESVEPLPEPATAAANTPRPRTTPATTPVRPPAERAAAPAPPAASEPSAAQQPVLQTAANATSLQERIRTQLADAETNLKRLNPNELNVSARAQFDLAQGFIRQAKEAVQVKNFLYAEHLAKKAALVAGQLLKG